MADFPDRPRAGAEAHFRALPVACFEVDGDGRWTWCSDRCRDLLRGSGAEPAVPDLFALAPEAERGGLRSAWRDALAAAMPFTFTGQAPASAGGAPRRIRVRAQALPRSGGEHLAAGVIEDLTQEALRQDALLEETRRAQEESRQKSEFLAVMSHELRTPIHGVVGTAGLLQGTDLTEEQRELVDMLMQSADATLSVINNILDLSKMEAGRLELDSVKFEVRALVESVVGVAAPRAQEKRLELCVHVDPSVARMHRGDPQRIRQVLTNLLGNAVKFTSEGEVVVVVTPVDDSGGSDLVRFEVRDTGIGMSPEAQARLFDAYSQADSSITRRFGGTGLGLTISRRLVSLMGGVIGGEGEPGKGSTFWFTVVLERLDQVAEKVDPRVEALFGARALVVDDNAAARQALSGLLDEHGLAVTGAPDPAAGLELLRAAAAEGRPFAFLFLDSHAPDPAATAEMTRHVAADPALADVRVILCQSFGHRGRAEVAAAQGVAAHLPKPVREEAVVECLGSLADGGVAGRGARRGRTSVPAPTATHARVLVVDDNLVNLRVATKVLARRGCLVDTATNGREAVEAVQGQPYAVVFMDCLMPEMDGYEATRRIREWEKGSGRRVPIVAMTARAMEGDREKAMGPGMDDYLSKPVRNEDFDAVLDRWVAHGALLRATPGSAAPSGADAPEAALDPRSLDDLEALQGEDSGEDIVGELVDLYVGDAPGKIDAIAAGLAAGDADAVEHAAHALKGSSASLGAGPLAALCKRLETMGRHRDLQGGDAVLAEVRAEYARVIDALKARRTAGKR